MALFKVLRGDEGNLPVAKTDGYAYFCTDTGSFYIDHKNNNNELIRSKISAEYADKLRYTDSTNAVVEINPSEIATKSDIANKADIGLVIQPAQPFVGNYYGEPQVTAYTYRSATDTNPLITSIHAVQQSYTPYTIARRNRIGCITVALTPTGNYDTASKYYVDTIAATKANKSITSSSWKYPSYSINDYKEGYDVYFTAGCHHTFDLGCQEYGRHDYYLEFPITANEDDRIKITVNTYADAGPIVWPDNVLFANGKQPTFPAGEGSFDSPDVPNASKPTVLDCVFCSGINKWCITAYSEAIQESGGGSTGGEYWEYEGTIYDYDPNGGGYWYEYQCDCQSCGARIHSEIYRESYESCPVCGNMLDPSY